MFCNYKHILGIPGEGVHKHILGIAWMDVLMTIIGAFILSYLFKWSFIYTLIILFILGILLHRIFCVNTTVDNWLKKHFFN
jgi:hypothetical protein